MSITRESDLYLPIKGFLEGQGYVVKGEVGSCDIVARRDGEEPVIVELKQRFSLDLVLQAIARQKLSDKVYVAVADEGRGATTLRRRYREVLRLCRMIGLGLLIVRNGASGSTLVEPRLDPLPYRPRKSRRRRERLLKEFAHRVGDPNTGGTTGRPILTAYRQDALRCAIELDSQGPLKLADVRDLSGVLRAGSILQKDFYGWFDRIERGVYAVSPKGRTALETFADAVTELRSASEAKPRQSSAGNSAS